jgi:putative ABC transport system permease protein
MRGSILRLWNITRVGFKSILRNKLRSSLTMLGVVIGVACIIGVVAIGSGAAKSVQSTINALGSNYIMVIPGASTQSGARIFTGQSSLTIEDALAIARDCPAVAYVSPNVRSSGQVVAGEMNWSTQVYGVGVDWTFIRTWNVEKGAFFGEGDVRAGTKVAVLGTTVAENLFGDSDPVGQLIRIRNVPFRVVGVLEKKGGNMMGQDQDDQIVIPYTTAMKRLSGSNRIQAILVGAVSAERVGEATEQIEALLRQRHRIGPSEDSDFMLRSQEEIASSAQETTRTMSLLLVSIGAISLLVGGIGIMNIMLVSVTERTREIGIRLAIGAKGRHVLMQFLLEAVALSVMGGIIGIGLGILASKLITKFAGWPVDVTTQSILLAFGFAAAIGIFFGWYPARKAARLDPIEALRYE